MKAQGESVLHGTAAKFDTFSNEMRGSITGAKSAKGAIWLTDDARTAKAYSIHAAETGDVTKAMEEAKQLEKIAQKSGLNSDWGKYDKKMIEAEELDSYDARYNRRQNSNVKDVVIDKNTKFYKVDAKGKTPQELSDEGGIDSCLDQQVQQAKTKGFDGIKISNLDDAVGLYNQPATHYAIFDAEKLKTRSQLESIWNKANSK